MTQNHSDDCKKRNLNTILQRVVYPEGKVLFTVKKRDKKIPSDINTIQRCSWIWLPPKEKVYGSAATWLCSSGKCRGGGGNGNGGGGGGGAWFDPSTWRITSYSESLPSPPFPSLPQYPNCDGGVVAGQLVVVCWSRGSVIIISASFRGRFGVLAVNV